MSCLVTELDMSVNGTVIQEAGKTFTLSKRYMNIVVAGSILNILYQRIPIKESELKMNTRFEDVPFVQIKYPKSTDPLISNLIKWLKAIKDAINKNYLKMIYIFLKDGNTKEILEFYRFKLKYNLNNDKVDRNDPTELRESTLNLYATINKLGKYEKLKNFIVSVEFAYHEHTPMSYEPQNFVSTWTPDCLKVQNYTPFGYINTGFHSLTCYSDMGNAKIKDNSPTKKTLVSHNTSKNLSLSTQFTNYSDTDAWSSKLGENPIQCLCNLPVKLWVPMLKCSKCVFMVHAPCYGYFQPYEEDFFCLNCQSISMSLRTREYGDFQIVAKFRLSLHFLRESGKVDETILEGHRKEVYEMINNHKIIRDDNTIDKDVLSAVIKKYSESNQSESM